MRPWFKQMTKMGLTTSSWQSCVCVGSPVHSLQKETACVFQQNMSESAAHSLHSLQTSRLPSLVTFLCVLANVGLNVYSDLESNARPSDTSMDHRPRGKTAGALTASIPMDRTVRPDASKTLLGPKLPRKKKRFKLPLGVAWLWL